MADPGPDSIRFEAVVALANRRAVIVLPADASAALPSRGQVAVTGSLAGRAFTTVVEPDGRRGHWIDLEQAGRRRAGVKPGTSVAVELVPTREWPEPEVPDDLAAALADAPDLDETWRSITPMARWEWVRWVCATANPDTRARRVEVSIDKLRSGKRRPCCFDLSSCTVPEVARSGKLVAAE